MHRLLVALAILAFMCLPAPGTARAQDAQPWEIAVVGPMSGNNSHLGRAMADAAQLRANQINAAGGVRGRQVRIVEHDDRNDPAYAGEVAQRVAQTGNTIVVLGHRTSGTSIAAGPVYQQNEVPVISGTATADAVTLNNPWYFRVVYNNHLQSDFIANYINGILKFEYVTLISTDSAYGKSLADAFRSSVESLPLQIAHTYEVEADDIDIDLRMAGIVSELSLAPNSGMIFLAMNAENAAHFVREMRNSGFTFPIFGADSINQEFPRYFEPDPVLKTSRGDFTDQIYAATSMIWDVANENAVQFRNAFRRAYGRWPDSGTALYYDAASLAMLALERAELTGTDLAKDRTVVRDYLASIDAQEKAFSGITGQIHFDESGNAVKTVSIGVFQLEEFVSAPVQLEPVLDPTMVPNFSDKREAGAIIPYQNGYVHATQIVYAGIDLNEVSNLDTATGNYTLDFYLWFKFRGDLDLDKIEFSNAADDIKLTTPIWSRERNGMNVQTFKVRGVFHGDFVFREYPFDEQEIVLEIRHRDRTRESLNFVVDRLGMRLTGEDVTLLQRVNEDNVFRTSPGWRVTDAEIFQDLIKTASTLGETLFYQGETAINFSRLKLTLHIARHFSSYSTTIFLPMAILFVIGLLIFFVPVDELPPRLSGGVLLLVTVALLRARLSNDLPSIGYLVAMDYIFFALQIIMWFGITVSVLCFWFFRHNRAILAKRINAVAAGIYPLPVIAVFIGIGMQVS